MAFELNDLFKEKVRKFGSAETNVEFRQKFLDCFNYVLDDIENVVGIGTDRVSVTNVSVDLAEQTYRGVCSFGTDYYLCMDNEFTLYDSDKLEPRYLRKLKQARAAYRRSQTLYGPKGDLS